MERAATAVLYSKTFLIVYFVNLFVNYMLLVWLLVATITRDYVTLTGAWMFVFEVVTTVFLFFETAVLRMASVGFRSFFLHQSNVYDMGVLFLSVVVIVGAKTLPLVIKWTDVANAATVCARFFVQQLRLIAVIKNQYRNFNSQSRVSIFLSAPSSASSSTAATVTAAAMPPTPSPGTDTPKTPDAALLTPKESLTSVAASPEAPLVPREEENDPFQDSDSSSDEGDVIPVVPRRQPLGRTGF